VSGLVQSGVSRLAAACPLAATLKVRRRSEAAEFALDQSGESDCRAVLEIATDDLHADRQTVVATADRRGRRRQAVQRSDAGLYALIVVRHLGAVDVELAGVLRRVIVWEGHGRHRRAQHDVDFLE
jgi:hypothetical protein